jgi:tetratricopeptide (TPR) repeat protein
MAKKNKKECVNPDYVLARAEKLFKAGNYRLAQLEFEKAGEIVNSPELSQKLKTCRDLAERARADELVKRGKKCRGKGNVHEALACFVEAQTVLKDDGLETKIAQLRQRLGGLEAEKEAGKAEAEGQYQKAAELYRKAFDVQRNDLYALKMAHCLARAGRSEEAVSIFEQYDLSNDWAGYDYGWVLAQIGRFFECLQVWDRIPSNDEGFKGQKQQVRGLLHDALFERFERDRDYAGIYREGTYLLASEDLKELRNLVEHCRYAWIEELWKQGKHEVIAGLLPDIFSKTDAAQLLLRAKNTFKLLETSGVIQDDLPMLWLTVLFGEAFEQFPCDAEKRAAVRQELLQGVERMLIESAGAGQGSAKNLLTLWDAEKGRIQDLHRLTGDRGDLSALVCTPQYALRTGASARVLRFIKKNRKSFKNREDYLLLGSYYSRAGKALLLLDRGDLDEALACLPDLADADDFSGYGAMRVDFSLGLQWLDHGGHKSKRYFETASELFHLSKECENRLVQKALSAGFLPELDRCLEALEKIHKKRPSRQIRKALSFVISKRALAMQNDGTISDKVLSLTLKKALDLDPQNAQALGGLNDARLDLELEELATALKKHKMNRACSLASQSEYPEVREHFFEYFEELLDFIEEADLSAEKAAFLLNEIYSWCDRVDDTHPILGDIVEMLDEINGENTNESIPGFRY